VGLSARRYAAASAHCNSRDIPVRPVALLEQKFYPTV
jgi:hypothetical protein